MDLNRNGRCRLIRGPMQCPPIQGPAAVAMTLRLGRGLINQIRGSLTLLLLAMSVGLKGGSSGLVGLSPG